MNNGQKISKQKIQENVTNVYELQLFFQNAILLVKRN